MKGRTSLGLGLAVGIAVGTGIGMATHQVARGVSWGAVLGALFGLGLSSRKKPMYASFPHTANDATATSASSTRRCHADRRTSVLLARRGVATAALV